MATRKTSPKPTPGAGPTPTKEKTSAKRGGAKAPFVYRGVPANKIQTALLAPPGSSSNWFKITDYNIAHVLRVLPNVHHPDDAPWVPHVMHYRASGSGQGGWMAEGRSRSITCLKAHFNQFCPVCALHDWLKANGQNERAQGMRAQSQYYVNVVDRESGQVMTWGAKKKIIESLQALSKTKAGADLYHPDKGRDIEVIRTGNPKVLSSIDYQVVLDSDVTAIDIPDWWEKCVDLSTLVPVFTEEQIVKIIYENCPDLPLDEVFDA